MPEQTFRSPNFFEREINLSAPAVGGPVGTPAGVIGTSNRGPAFVPVTVAKMTEFEEVFGTLDPKKFGPYAVNEFLKHKTALTFLRVLGAGANESEGDILAYETTGRVRNAGLKVEGISPAISGSDGQDSRHTGVVQFISARHQVTVNEAYGNPMFTDNNSVSGTIINLVRGMIITPTGSRVMVLGGDEQVTTASFVLSASNTAPYDYAATGSIFAPDKFKLIISSTLGNVFYNTDGQAGIKIFTASLDPSSDDYYAKILNTDPDRLITDQHVLYADFPVDAEVAAAVDVGILSGTAGTTDSGGETTTSFRALFGAFDTRYTTPKTTWFISQPFGNTEYDLFYFETLDDGEYANKLFKVSISNIQKSVDDSNPYGTFNVEIRSWEDTDTNPRVLELFPNCSLDPKSDNYVAKVIGDRKIYYNFDATVESERRVATSGRYSNVSKYVRIRMADQVDRKVIPGEALPFGFRGAKVLKTTPYNRDYDVTADEARVAGVLSGDGEALSGSILPPVPMRFKVTRGERLNGGGFVGAPSVTELANSIFYWGVRFERLTDVLNPNIITEKNALLENYTKFLGIEKLDVLVTGSGADDFNHNKFSLSKVALAAGTVSDLTASVNDHMKEAAYFRNGKLDLTRYTVLDNSNSSGSWNRMTFATLLTEGTAAEFNRYSPYAKFTNFFQGGYDGVNFLDRDARRMNDKSTSFEANGGAEATYTSPGYATNMNGTGQDNSNVASYKAAINIMTDPMIVNHNVLVVPGIRESFLTDFASDSVRDYGLAYYVMDIASYNDDAARLYDDDTSRPSVIKTSAQFESRVVDNNFVGTYWPDIVIDDEVNNRRVAVPASIAAVGALGFNDKVRYPWFAPAGFNRASLDFVKNVKVRLNVGDRDTLYDARINPIATFPRQGFAIWGQKTLQINKSALDRVNVRRMLLEVKRIIINIARRITFEQNTPEVRNNFVAQSTLQLGVIQAQAGIEQFKVVMNESNNTQEDIDLNRLNGRVVVVPTRTIEFIAIDFIVTRAGVEFV